MWKIFLIQLYLILISSSLLGDEGGLSILQLNKKRIELIPGSNSNIAVMLVNSTDTAAEFSLKISTPEGLSQIIDYSSIRVEAQSKTLKIFSFYVNTMTRVGDYSITIEAFTKASMKKIGEVLVPVEVMPKYEMHAKVLNAPKYVYSGDTIEAGFFVQNLSNISSTIEIMITSDKVAEMKTFTIDPDSSVNLNFITTTKSDISHFTRKSIVLNAAIVEAPETATNLTCIIDVIPSTQEKFESYNKIPTTISGLFVTNNQTGERLFGYMFDVVGSGMISPKKKREISFHLRGPNREGNPILGQTDEYNITYSSPTSKLTVGDNSYSLTDLTEGARSGRGMEYRHLFKNKIGLGTFINYPRFYPHIDRVMSIYGFFKNEKKIKLKTGYLNKLLVDKTITHLVTVSGEISPFKWGEFAIEYALGNSNQNTSSAYAAEMRIHFSSYRFFAGYTYASPLFPGYLTNSRFINLGAMATIFKKVNLAINYNLNHSNIALDTIFSNAPYSNNLNFTLSYNFNYNNSLSIGAAMNKNEDMSIEKQFFYTEFTGRISSRNKIKRLGVDTDFSIGKNENFLPLKYGETTQVMHANLSVQYNIGNNLFAKGFVSYYNGEQYLEKPATNFYYGLVFDASYKDKIKLQLQYQNDYQIDEYYKDRSLLGLQTVYALNQNHEIGAGLNYDLRKNTLSETVFSASLRYTYKLKIPVSRKEDGGGLQGKINNHGADQVKGIMITIGGNTAFTDKDGAFQIPYLTSGTYFLFIDNSNTGINTITEKAGPYPIEVLPGQMTYFEIGLTKSASIIGRIAIEEDENTNSKGFIPVKAGLDRLIIEMNNDGEMYRLLTDLNGDFEFNDLRPGEWSLVIYSRGIPEGYELQNTEYLINLTPGESKDFKIIVRKKARKIKFQKR